MYFSQLNAYYHCISKYSMKLCGFAEKLKCIIYRINVYSDRPCGAVRKIGICRWKTGHRTTLSFRTSAHYFRGNLHRIPYSLSSYRPFFAPYSGIYRCIIGKWYFCPGDCHASVRYFIAMTGKSINSNLSVCLRKPIIIIGICWAGGAVAFYTTENSRSGWPDRIGSFPQKREVRKWKREA